MNVSRLLETRRPQWSELEQLCDAMDLRGRTGGRKTASHRGSAGVARFATLYRSACADLALAEAYQLPPGTVTYLHRLVARAHSQLYRTERVEGWRWMSLIFREAPRQIFADPCVHVATVLFFGFFALAMFLAYETTLFPQFAEKVVGQEGLDGMQDMYAEPINGSLSHYVQMSGFYINHNTSIGLKCFAMGPLIIPTLLELLFNAVYLGTVFGFMARPGVTGGDHFYEFVTAHGPFELTAIALAAGAGLRIGVGVIRTGGLNRLDSIRVNAIAAVPIVSASAVLFFLAALTEGFLSPSPLPYVVKASWAIVSSGCISFYLVVLGFPSDRLFHVRSPAASTPAISPFDRDDD